MNENKTFSAELVNVESLHFPFVYIIYKVKEGIYRKGLLMVDTGSTENMLSSGIVEFLDPAYSTGESKNMSGIQCKGIECPEYNIDFCIDNVKFSEKFYVHPVNFDGMFGEGIIMGLVGSGFLRKYGLVLDYHSETIRQNLDGKRINKDDCKFYFPLSFGFSRFNMPTIAVCTDNNGTFFMFADSGTDGNTISKHDLELLAGNIEYTGKKYTDISIGNNTNSKEAKAVFNLYTLKQDNNLYPIEYETKFHVTDQFDHLVNMDDVKDKSGNPMHISGLISSPFMLKNKWVLDFSIGAIYSLKEAA